MKILLLGSLCSLSLAMMLEGEEKKSTPSSTPDFTFREVAYYHRWSGKDQHEFTPAKQEDLEAWTEMVTIDSYPDVHDGEALATKANAVLENYKSHHAIVVRTNSSPATKSKPAEHFIAVIFPQPNFLEAAFAHFVIRNGVGYAVVYSHRIYGSKAGEPMSAWVGANGPNVEKALMEWNALPSAYESGHVDRL